MIFLTVGTQFPFDRLVKTIDSLCKEGILYDTVYAQIGNSDYKPEHFEYVQTLDKNTFDKTIQACSAMIGHAGMGTISMAQEYLKPLLVLPRLAYYNEVVNDHQVDIAKKFDEEGYLLSAFHENEIRDKIALLKTFKPRKRVAEPQGIIETIKDFLQNLQKEKYGN